jgi:uncharacterized YccA/Bax inhibitor family protein
MTVGGSAVKSFLLLLLVVGFAVFGWNFALRVVATTSGMLFLVGYIILIALTFAAVSNPRIAPVLVVVYAALMGTWMGAISRVYEEFHDGIVGQAVFASLSVFAVCLLLYGARIVKVTRKFAAVVIGATLGIGLLYLVTWLLSLFEADLVFLSQPTPLGIGLSIAICLVAALNLILDFGVIEGGAHAGARRRWSGWPRSDWSRRWSGCTWRSSGCWRSWPETDSGIQQDAKSASVPPGGSCRRGSAPVSRGYHPL